MGDTAPREGHPPSGETTPREGDPLSGETAPRQLHPLLGESDEVLLAEGIDEVDSTAGPELAELIRAVVGSGREGDDLASVTVDYPLNESIFPPEIVAPTFLWHEGAEEVDTWLFDAAFGDDGQHLYVLSPGNPPPSGPIDPRCITKTNEVYQPTPYQASAKSWTPGGDVWAAVKQCSAGTAASVTVLGFRSAEPRKALSRGRVTIRISQDPVGAPIFYRDVPLAPSETEEGVIKPLGKAAVPLIGWRLRDISKPESRLLLTGMPTCANCHSFSSDGKTLGMDLDGPQGDKGTYAITPVTRQMVIEPRDVITWNSFAGKPEGHKTIGFMSQISPDGQYAITTLNEEMYVRNFLDYKFLQVFYPTRGILAYYSRATGEMKALGGADDPAYVHCDPVWTPDGQDLVFARAEARDAYPEDAQAPVRANDPAETPIQYDLYRMPFNGGRGGKPEPIAGASNNGMSNSFPKVSPDGKWIVFVQARNGQLMRPDSTLWIVPVSGGEARPMRCNARRMNSWHSFSPNGRWMVFASKANTPYTQMFLTHLDDDGNDSPAILIPNSTAANRAVNIPEFLNASYDGLVNIRVPAVEYVQYGLRGLELLEQGRLDEALAQFETSVKLHPDYLDGHVNIAIILGRKGRVDEAAARLEEVLERAPKNWLAHANLGVILASRGMLDEAMAQFKAALEIKPDCLEARANLGKALLEKGMLEEATALFREATELEPENPVSHFNLGNVLFVRGMAKEAAAYFEKTLEVDPGFIDARLMLGNALGAQGEFESAAAQYQNALEVAPEHPRAIDALAWLLATCPKDEVRNGARAVQLAESACKAARYQDPVLMSTLAAAYAEVGKWSEAIATATNALNLTGRQNKSLADNIRGHLELYREGKPVRCP